MIPDVALTEVTYLLRKRIGFQVARLFVGQIAASNIPLQCIERNDLVRAYEVMSAYPESKLDFVDCCIVAIAERLRVTKICTIDRRDFSMIRPRHADYFELFPELL